MKDPSKISAVIVYCGGEIDTTVDRNPQRQTPEFGNDSSRLSNLQNVGGGKYGEHQNRLESSHR